MCLSTEGVKSACDDLREFSGGFECVWESKWFGNVWEDLRVLWNVRVFFFWNQRVFFEM